MGDPPRTVDLAAAFERIEEPWTPHVAAELNGQAVKLARLDGEFVWHAHPDDDELFYVLEGDLRIELRDADPVRLGPGQLTVIPRGVEHRPVATEETAVLLFEPVDTRNTGDVETEETHTDLDRV